jgi:hypothetical protein
LDIGFAIALPMGPDRATCASPPAKIPAIRGSICCRMSAPTPETAAACWATRRLTSSEPKSWFSTVVPSCRAWGVKAWAADSKKDG